MALFGIFGKKHEGKQPSGQVPESAGSSTAQPMPDAGLGTSTPTPQPTGAENTPTTSAAPEAIPQPQQAPADNHNDPLAPKSI